MGASVGKPYCVKGQEYLGTSPTRTCKECEHIRYIGCPGWKQNTRNPKSNNDLRTSWWIRWWYYDEPIDDRFFENNEYGKKKKKKKIAPPSPEPCNSTIHRSGDPRGRGGI